jgi:Na+/melibiose symporter-like transporter
MKSSNQKVSMAEKIGYSLGDGSASLVFQMMMMFHYFSTRTSSVLKQQQQE